MKTFTALAAALAAVALPLAAPAQAYTPDRLLTAEQRGALGTDLKRAGVDLIFTAHCPDENMAGVYNHQRMTLKVCTNNIHSGAFMDEVIAHETMHVVQHCVGQAMGVDGLLPLHTLLSQSDPEFGHKWLTMVNAEAKGKAQDVHSSAKYNGRLIATSLEREAYALEDDPTAVHTLLRATCLGED